LHRLSEQPSEFRRSFFWTQTLLRSRPPACLLRTAALLDLKLKHNLKLKLKPKPKLKLKLKLTLKLKLKLTTARRHG
jgi:hypothetical protein